MSTSVLTQRCVGILSRRAQHPSKATLRSISAAAASAAHQESHHDSHHSSSSSSCMLPWLAACAVGSTVSAWKTSNEPQHITQTESAARRLRLLAPVDSFTHRTLKELNEQPEAIARTLNFGECMTFEKVLVSDLDQNQDRVTKINHLTLSAQGTSLQAARYGERLMKHLGAFTSVASVDSAEMQTSDFRCFDRDSSGLIVVSDCGGRTKESVPDVVPSLMEMGVTVMNVVNTLTSLLASTDTLDVFGSGAESESMSSTKVFTTQVTVLALISLWFKENRDRALGRPSAEALELKEALMRLPIVFGMTLRKRDQCREIAKRLLDKEQCYVLGAGFSEPVAQEGAFIVTEISNMNAEDYKVGVTQSVGGGTPLIVFILNDEHSERMRKAAHEAKAKGADLIVITDDEALAQDLDESPIVLPTNGPLTALGGILPLSLIAYELAMLRGINPDGP